MMAATVTRKNVPFTYTWTIENIPLTTHLKARSPLFIAKSVSKKKWYIYVHLASSYMWCTLVSEDFSHGSSSIVDVEFSLLSADGSQIISKRNNKNRFLPIVSRETFLERKSEFLPDNTLTIQCRMWRKGFFLWKNCSNICHVRTRFLTYTESFIWPVEKFSDLKSSKVKDFTELSVDKRKVYPLKPFTPEGPYMALVLYLKRNSESEDVCIDFLISNDRNYSFCWEISAIAVNGEVIASKIKERRSFYLSEFKSFISLISKNYLMTNKNLYLPNDTLLLKCAFKLFTGVVLNEKEYCTPNVSLNIEGMEEVSEEGEKVDDTYPFEKYFTKETHEIDIRDNCAKVTNLVECCSDSCSLKYVLRHLYYEAPLSYSSQRKATELLPIPLPQA